MTENTNNKPSIEETNDGSHTLYSNRFDQHYHNMGGAVAESEHVFFEINRLEEALRQKTEINILEVGFGTALNFLLLADKYLSTDTTAQINYHTIEAFPVSDEIIQLLNYSNFLDHREIAKKLPAVFNSIEPGKNEFKLLNNITLSVYYGTFNNFTPAHQSFDYIFHDAFSPKANPELWTDTVFKKLLHWSHSDAVLTTYCAASKIRGALAVAGWKVARAPGALRKREMTIASPDENRLESFKRVNEKRLAQRYKRSEFS